MINTKSGFFVAVIVVVSLFCIMCITGCSLKLVPLHPKEQLDRDLEVYQQGYNVGYKSGYKNGVDDMESIMEYQKQFEEQLEDDGWEHLEENKEGL